MTSTERAYSQAKSLCEIGYHTFFEIMPIEFGILQTYS